MKLKLLILIALIIAACLQVRVGYEQVRTRKNINSPVRFQLGNAAALFRVLDSLDTTEIRLEKVEFIRGYLKVKGSTVLKSVETLKKRLTDSGLIKIFEIKIEENGVLKFICRENSLIF